MVYSYPFGLSLRNELFLASYAGYWRQHIRFSIAATDSTDLVSVPGCIPDTATICQELTDWVPRTLGARVDRDRAVIVITGPCSIATFFV